MPHLVVTAPGGRKVEIECEASATFGDIKARIEQSLGVPPDKQRLICSGKERKNAGETLESAGVTAKSKLMLMLAPGYTMPAAPAVGGAEGETSATVTAPTDPGVTPTLVEGELPLGDATPASTDEEARIAMVHVKQGRNRYDIRVRQGLDSANFGELADYMASELLSGGVQSSELRFLCRGKTAERSEVLCSTGGHAMTVMLLFRENFHVAADGLIWLKDQSAQLAEAELELEKLKKRVEANFSDGETSVRLAEVGAVVETMLQSIESVRVREERLPEMEKFRDRVRSAHAAIESLRKGVRL
eukprot:TRINITY_DN17769_c0_g1_i3.p1 TRINITY_DN17769_c0_g1~~TRINITY_DN17769_c0_g1_i3.p1  ORF type:complete len:303 (+),score=51.69 TRINITY_DN17769_c0_g1_i3:85-993(+)